MSDAEAAPAAGYTASFIPAGAGTTDAVSGAVNPVTDTLYVGEETATGYQLAVLDGSTRKTEATIALASEPYGVAVNSDTNTVYVSYGGEIAVINGANNSVTTTIQLPGGGDSGGIAVDSDTNAVYAVIDTGTSGSVVVIDGSTNTIDTTISSGGETPYGIAVDESTGIIWVANYRSSVVAISATAPYSIIHAISVTAPDYLAVNPVTDTVYTLSGISGDLTTIDGTDYTITTTVPLQAGLGNVVVDSSADVVFANGYGGTYVIDGTTNAVTDTLGVGGEVIAADPDTDTVYEVADSNGPPGVWAVTPSSSNGISPLLTPPSSGTATEYQWFGVALSVNLSGLPTPTFTETGALPPGVTLSPEGELSGTPTAAGVYPITVIASNGVAPDFSQPFTLTVVPPLPRASIASTGTAQVITATDAAGNLDYWWQAAGTGTWHQQQVAAATGGVTYTNPSITWTGTAEVITATDSAGNLDYWWQAPGTSTWHQQQVAAASSSLSYASPSITWTGTAEVITAQDSQGNLDYWWQAAGTAPWHQQQVTAATGGVTYANPAITWTGTAEVITAQDSQGNLDYWWQAAGTAPWHQQQVTAATGGVTYTNPAITWTGTAEVITAQDSQGNLDYWWQAAGTAPWNQQQVAAGGTFSYANPAIVWTGTAEVITAQDSQGNVDYWWQAAGTAPWNEQQVGRVGSVTYQSPAIAWTGTAEIIAAPDSGGNLDYWWQQAGTVAWHQQQVGVIG